MQMYVGTVDALPHQVRQRAQSALLGNRPFTDCGPDKVPDYPQPGDFWAGPLRFNPTRAIVELWAEKNHKLMTASRKISNWATDKLSFPKTDGKTVIWLGKVENPLQDVVPSTAVTPYKRFITTLVDPSIILGIVRAVRGFFNDIQKDEAINISGIERHEVVDYEADLPEF
jgi:hypothetical protein